MSSFRVLDAADARERAEWTRLWESWADREVFAHPAYVELFARPGQRTLCASSSTPSGGVLYPFLLRPIASEPWGEGETARDITSAYGYSGPFSWGETSADDFWKEVDAWLATQDVVSSFTRLSLFPDQLLRLPSEPETAQSNIVRSLDLDSEALWKEYAHKVRKNVNKARRANLRVEVDESGTRLDEFLNIYESTMDRRDAKDDYYFSEDFFRTIVHELAGSYAFFHVLSEDRVVSTELVLVSVRHLYSFLGGTLADAFDLRPNDLLKHEVIEWGRSQGKKAFVLGGGYGGEDGIFKYKLSFAPNGAVPFRVMRLVHRPEEATRLVAKRQAYESAQGTPWEPRAGFFPPYRS